MFRANVDFEQLRIGSDHWFENTHVCETRNGGTPPVQYNFICLGDILVQYKLFNLKENENYFNQYI